METLPSHLMVDILQPIITDWLLTPGVCHLNRATMAMLLQYVKGESMEERLREVIEISDANKKLSALNRLSVAGVHVNYGYYERVGVGNRAGNRVGNRINADMNFYMKEHDDILEIRIDVDPCFVNSYKTIVKRFMRACAYVHDMCEIKSVIFVPVQKISEIRGDGFIHTNSCRPVAWEKAYEINPKMHLLTPDIQKITRWIEITRLENVERLRALYMVV